MFRDYKLQLTLLIQFAIWISSLIVPFLTLPPTIGLTESVEGWLKLIQLLLAITLGLTIVPFKKLLSNKYTWHWWITSFILFTLSISLVFSYFSALSDKSIVLQRSTTENIRVAVGDELTKPAVEYIHEQKVIGNYVNNVDLVEAFVVEKTSDLNKIWTLKSIRKNQRQLVLVYTVSTFVLCLTCMTLIQAIKCNNLYQ